MVIPALLESIKNEPKDYSEAELNTYYKSLLTANGNNPVRLREYIKSLDTQLEAGLCNLKTAMNINMANAGKCKLKMKINKLDKEYQVLNIKYNETKKKYKMVQEIKAILSL